MAPKFAVGQEVYSIAIGAVFTVAKVDTDTTPTTYTVTSPADDHDYLASELALTTDDGAIRPTPFSTHALDRLAILRDAAADLRIAGVIDHYSHRDMERTITNAAHHLMERALDPECRY